jgi:uncharacterized membrane protein YcaP (DUF421 family)
MWLDIWQKYLHDWNTHTTQDVVAQIISVVVILMFGIIAIKIVGKKSINTLTIPNILFIFVLSSTLGALITKPYRIFVGLLVVSCIVLFVFLLEKLIVKSNMFEQFFIPKPTILYKDGVFLESNILKSKMTIDQIESWIRVQGFPSIEVCKTVIIEYGGNLSFELYPEYEPIKKIYFDNAMEQILKAINNSQYQEIQIPEMHNVFDETRGKVHKEKVPTHLE